MTNHELILEKIKKAGQMTAEQRAAEKAAREAEQKEKLKALIERLKAHMAEQKKEN
jgi:hypothetical protein